MAATTHFKVIKGGITAPRGFLASGIHCGIKPVRHKKLPKDLALIFSEEPCATAATFTTNKIKAAPVRLSMRHLRGADARAVIANSGNANACTGAEGIAAARRMAAAAAQQLEIPLRQVLVCSTGRIGTQLPVSLVEESTIKLHRKLSVTGSRNAAEAIMTSDTFPKEIAVEFLLGGKPVRIGGVAKGAGMIDPNMATMLAFLTTDANIGARELAKALQTSVEQSFNRITIDGDMSTNDTALVFANGCSRCPRIESSNGNSNFAKFQEALDYVTGELARMIVMDGESVTKFVELNVKKAATYQDARKIARAIANSMLVKCAWYGGDPNWGRMLDAAGYSGARIREEMVDIYYNGLLAVRNGIASGTPVSRLKKVLKPRRISITIELHLGEAEYTVYTTDLTPGYVKFNMGE
jgi:glutamate N-acetyltransferase/amino-acid N-acetyltransferase